MRANGLKICEKFHRRRGREDDDMLEDVDIASGVGREGLEEVGDVALLPLSVLSILLFPLGLCY